VFLCLGSLVKIDIHFGQRIKKFNQIEPFKNFFFVMHEHLFYYLIKHKEMLGLPQLSDMV